MKNGKRADREYADANPSGRRRYPDGADAEQITIEQEEDPVNEYYLKVSKIYKFAKFLTLALFIGYLIVMMCMYRSSITYDNLMYLIRDFETDVDVSSKGFEGISYNESDKMSFALYKDRLALATGTEFTLYNTTGAVEVEYDHSMENPKVETGEKYALVYDVGGTSYSLFNTIARVNTKRTEYAIQGADICDGGAFSLITRSKENRYLVSFYDSSFRELSRVFKDKYVTDVALDETGKKYAIVSCNVTNSDFVAEIMTGTVNSDVSQTFELSGALPLSVDWLNGDTFVVVCDSMAVFADSEGNMKTSCSFSDIKITSAYVHGGKLLVAGSENTVGSTSGVIIYDSEGAIVDKFTYNGKISQGVLSDNYVFCLSGEEIIRRDFSGSISVVPCPAYTKTIVPYYDNVAVCTGTGVAMGFEAVSDTQKEAGTSSNGENAADKDDTQGGEIEENGEDGADDTVNVEMDTVA